MPRIEKAIKQNAIPAGVWHGPKQNPEYIKVREAVILLDPENALPVICDTAEEARRLKASIRTILNKYGMCNVVFAKGEIVYRVHTLQDGSTIYFYKRRVSG